MWFLLVSLHGYQPRSCVLLNELCSQVGSQGFSWRGNPLQISCPSPEFRGSLSLSLQKWWVFYGFLWFSGDPTLKSLAFPGFPGPALENPSGFTRRVPPAGTCCWKSTADTAPTMRWSPRRPRLGEWRWGWHETIGWMETVWTCYFKQQKWWFNSEKYTRMMKHGDLIVSDIYSM